MNSEIEIRLETEKNRLERVKHTLEVLGEPRRVAKDKVLAPKFATTFRVDEWEKRANNLVRLAEAKEKIIEHSIPNIQMRIKALDHQRQVNIAEKSRDSIYRAVEKGLLPEAEKQWIDKIMTDLMPQVQEQKKVVTEVSEKKARDITCPNTLRFLEENSDCRSNFLRLMRSSAFPEFLNSINHAFRNSDTQLLINGDRAVLDGSVFESLAYDVAAEQIKRRLGYSISVLSPDETMELFKLGFPDADPVKGSLAQKDRINGITVVDGIVVRTDKTKKEIIGFAEYSLCNDINDNPQKHKQAEIYIKNTRMVKDNFARFVDPASSVYSPEANKLIEKILGLTGDSAISLRKNLMIFYFQPRDGVLIDDLEPEEVYRLPNIKTADVWNFVCSVVEDCKNIYQLTSDISADNFNRSVDSRYLIID